MRKAKWLRSEDSEGLPKNVRCFALDMDGTLYLEDQ
jgi:hypothetical protein